MTVSRVTKLQEYAELITEWNNTFNLVSTLDLKFLHEKHIRVCGELMRYIRNRDIHLVDLGSGAGFPGIVLSILGIKNVTLIEANEKRAAFLLQAAKLSDNNIVVINDRIENQKIACDIIAARGLASISQIMTYLKYVRFRQKMLLIKGPFVEKELIEHKRYDFKVINSSYNNGKIVVVTRNV